MSPRLAEIWSGYANYSAELSRVARPLGFAAVGLVWVLRDPAVGFTGSLRWALTLTVAFFAADLLQYYAAMVTVGLWARTAEKQLWRQDGNLDGAVERPRWLDVPARVFFHLKILSLLAAFVSLGGVVL